MWEYPTQTLCDQITARSLQKRPFQEQELFSIIASVIEGMSCLQLGNVKHLNLITTSILIDEAGAVKVTDPFTEVLPSNFDRINSNRKITNVYISPEQCQSLKNMRPVPNRNSFKSDVFIFGVILLQCGLLQRMDSLYEEQFEEINWKQVDQKLRNFGDKYGSDLKLTVQTMLQRDPRQRMDWINLKQFVSSADGAGKEGHQSSQYQDHSERQTVPFAHGQPQQQKGDTRGTIHPFSPNQINQRQENRHQSGYGAATEPSHMYPNDKVTHQPQFQLEKNLVLGNSSTSSTKFPRQITNFPSTTLNNQNYLMSNPGFSNKNTPFLNSAQGHYTNNYTSNYRKMGLNTYSNTNINTNTHTNTQTNSQTNAYNTLPAVQASKITMMSSVGGGDPFRPYLSNSVNPVMGMNSFSSPPDNNSFQPKKYEQISSAHGIVNDIRSKPYEISMTNANDAKANQGGSLYSSPFKSGFVKDANSITYEISNPNSTINYQNINGSSLFEEEKDKSPSLNYQQLRTVGNHSTSTGFRPFEFAQNMQSEFDSYKATKNKYQGIGIQDIGYTVGVPSTTTTGSEGNFAHFSNYSNLNSNNRDVNGSKYNSHHQELKNTQQPSVGGGYGRVQGDGGVQGDGRVRGDGGVQGDGDNDKSCFPKLHQKGEQPSRPQPQKNESELEYVTEHFKQGSRYEGTKLNQMRHGQGKFFYQDGGMYDGNWKNNKMDGYGKLYYQSGKIAYDGNWKEDQFHGWGKLYNEEPDYLEGELDYQNFDLIDEYWTFYEGQFVCDEKEGEGKMVFSNGDHYEGNFNKDLIEGPGVFHQENAQVVRGTWSQNQLVEVEDQDGAE